MTTSKSIMTITSLALALMFGGGVYVLMNLGSIAERMAERIGTDTLGVAVEIGALEISLPEKKARVRNITIANPAGFTRPHIITIEQLDIALAEVGQSLINFKDITATGTEVFLEVDRGTTNLHALREGLKPADPAAAEENAPVKVILQRLSLSDIQLKPSVTLVSQQDLDTVVAPDIVLTGIGEKENGILAQEALAQIVADIAKRMNRTAGRAGFLEGLSTEVIRDMGISQVEAIKDRARGEIDRLKDSVKGVFGN